MSRARLFAIFFTAAFVFRMAIAWATGYLFAITSSEMMRIALNLVYNGAYANPYGSHVTGPTAHSTPVFPLFLAACIALCGKLTIAQAVIATVSCLCSALRCALVPLFALDAGLKRPAAILAGAMGVVYIGALETEIRGNVDGPYVALSLLGILWMSMRIWRGNTWQTGAPWGFFAFCGFSVLLNPSAGTVIIGIMVLGIFACAKEFRMRFLVRAAQLAAVVFAFLLPWGIRNYLALDAFILTRSNFGLELWLSNGPDRTYDLSVNFGHSHPYANTEEADGVAALGEAVYNKEKMDEALSWIWSEPGAFLRLTARRFFVWWFPTEDPLRWYYLPAVVSKALLTCLAFAGLWLLRPAYPLLFALIAATWLTFPDLYYLIQWSGRYRYPMEWQLVLCAAVALTELLNVISVRYYASGLSRPRPNPAT